MSIHQFISLHKEHQDWLHQLDLCQDEIKFFQNNLARLTGISRPDEFTGKIENYRQDCMKKLQQTDALRYQVYRNEAEVAKRMELADRLKGNVVPEETHDKLREMMDEFSLEFKAFKKNLTDFLFATKKESDRK